jgi:hypothetical protein
MTSNNRHDCPDDYQIIKPNRKVLGQSFADWTEDWWTWALQAPADRNPLLDETGEFANVNNNGRVHFIAGNFGGESERTVEVEGGKPLLIPILTNAYITFDTDEQPRRLANRELADWKRSVTDLFFEIDGVELARPRSYFVKSDFFSPGEAEPGSLLDAIDDEAPPGDDFFPSRAAGYWLMIKGLDRGEHELHFGGTRSDGFVSDVTVDVLIL